MASNKSSLLEQILKDNEKQLSLKTRKKQEEKRNKAKAREADPAKKAEEELQNDQSDENVSEIAEQIRASFRERMQRFKDYLTERIAEAEEEKRRKEEQEEEINRDPAAYSLLCCQLVEEAIHERNFSVEDPGKALYLANLLMRLFDYFSEPTAILKYERTLETFTESELPLDFAIDKALDGPENLVDKYDYEKLYEEILTMNRYDDNREKREDLYAVCLLALRVIIGRGLEDFDRAYVEKKLGLHIEFPGYDW